MDTESSILSVREYPLGEWGFGILMFAIAGFTAIGASGDWSISLIAGAAGVLFILFGAILVVTADWQKGTLTIRRKSVLRLYVREIPIDAIAAIQLEASRGSSSTYRIVVITKDNETIPFRTAYTSGTSGKEGKAKKFREFLGVGGVDMSLGGMLNQATSMAQQVFQENQEALPENITVGVHWKTQTVAFGGTAVTRWFSPDQQCPGGFIFVAQKVVGSPAIAGGLLGGMNKLFFHEVIGMYGFGSAETPGLESAMVLDSFDAQLDPHFTIFTSDPQAAREYLTWSLGPLVDWASRYPLKQMQSPRELFGQLVVMICPSGTYVASMGNMIPEAVQELTNLGVVLVKGKQPLG